MQDDACRIGAIAFLNTSVLNVAEKLFRVGLSPSGYFGIAAVLKHDLLQSNLYRILRLKALRYQFSRARRETFRIRQERLAVRLAIMTLEPAGRQAVVGALGFLIRKQ